MANGTNPPTLSRGQSIADSLLPAIALTLAIIVALIAYFLGSGSAMDRLKVITGYLILILVFFYGLMVLIAMVTKTIDLKYLVSEADGSASMSRFQLLIFTFVIALSLFMIVVGSTPPKFPEVPTAILTLLGISATTYAAGKALHPPPSDTPTTTEEEHTVEVHKITTE